MFGFRIFSIALLVVFQCLLAFASGAQSSPRTQEREQYEVAKDAIAKSGWKDFEQLRSGLDDYPLAIYLDYFKLSKTVNQVRPVEARRFVSLTQDSPLPNRFLAVYLNRAGKDRRWSDYLAVMPDEPNAIELKCYYFRAKLASGDQLAAWEGAERLWVHGKSRPKECDPLFTAWLKAGELDDEVVWARLLKAFEARQLSLMRYVARQGSDSLAPWWDKLAAIYRHPDKLSAQTLPADHPYSADVAAVGLAYLARYQPEQAMDLWGKYQSLLSFSDEQVHDIENAIALQGLFARSEAMVPWLEGAFSRLGDDKLVEIRLRWALAEQDWAAIEGTLAHLSPERAEASVWRYWKAVVAQHGGRAEEASEILEVLSLERGYYAFLASDRLGRAYSLNNQPLVLESAQLEPLRDIPAVQRVEELVYHEEQRLAHSEWYNILEDNGTQRRVELAQLASEEGWYSMAINAAAKAEAWDMLDLRFPMPWQETFAHYASLQQVPSTELMAIARRESAFFPQANSPVGARGLMQLMPATGQQVASSLGRKHSRSALYEVDHNVLLGSTYYRQLLDRYDGNRVFALSAYNAGPHRVDRWRNKDTESVPVEIWIETIPYKETRNYVQAVLSYNVVFQHLMGEDRGILSSSELKADY